jgi:hypothetical protein
MNAAVFPAFLVINTSVHAGSYMAASSGFVPRLQ